MKLYISSGRHTFTNHEERIEECNEALDNPEVIFEEAPVSRVSIRNRFLLILYAPLLMGVTYLWIEVILRILRLIFGDDQEIANQLALEHDLNRIHVDVPHTELIHDNRNLWMITNWLAIVWPIFILNVSPITMRYVVISVFQAVIILSSYLWSTLAFRDQFMADRINEHADEYDAGYLLIGGRHREGIESYLDSDSVTIV